MIETSDKKQIHNTNTVNPVVAGIVGVVVGASFAVAGAVAFKDEENHKKVKEMLVDVKDQAVSYIETLKTEPSVQEGAHELKKIVVDAKNDAKKSV